MEFESYYNEFNHICQKLSTNDLDGARYGVEKFILPVVDTDTPNEKLLSHIIASSLLKRIDRKLLSTKNIYLAQYDIPQIALFYKMAQAYPQVAASHSIANQYILEALQGLEEVTIFDIGIGKALQLEKLIQTLHEDNYPLKKISIIGLDPDEDNLLHADKIIHNLRRTTDYKIRYYPCLNLLENLSDHQFMDIKQWSNGNLVINAAFALHHVAHEPNDDHVRTKIFEKLAGLEPVIFTLIEPNANHDEENITKRLTNCWNHFGKVFRLIDESELDKPHKFVVKEKFFAREIKDIFGTSDYLRSERHESVESWMLRLVKAGLVPSNNRRIKINLPQYCQYEISDGYVSLGYDNTTLIGVFAYTHPLSRGNFS